MAAPTPSAPVRMDHVGIDVADLDAQIDFYVEAFDLEVEWRVDLPALRFELAFLLSPAGWRVELFHRAGAARASALDPDTQHDVLGIGHIAFTCSSADDVRAVHDRLVALGATSHLPPQPSPEPSLLLAYLADPEGNLIELVERH